MAEKRKEHKMKKQAAATESLPTEDAGEEAVDTDKKSDNQRLKDVDEPKPFIDKLGTFSPKQPCCF